MAEYLSEPEAWREVAARIEAKRHGYICTATDNLRCWDRTAERTWEQMHARLRAHGVTPDEAAFPDEDSSDRERYRPCRILAALFLALEAEDEQTHEVSP